MMKVWLNLKAFGILIQTNMNLNPKVYSRMNLHLK